VGTHAKTTAAGRSDTCAPTLSPRALLTHTHRARHAPSVNTSTHTTRGGRSACTCTVLPSAVARHNLPQNGGRSGRGGGASSRRCNAPRRPVTTHSAAARGPSANSEPIGMVGAPRVGVGGSPSMHGRAPSGCSRRWPRGSGIAPARRSGGGNPRVGFSLQQCNGGDQSVNSDGAPHGSGGGSSAARGSRAEPRADRDGAPLCNNPGRSRRPLSPIARPGVASRNGGDAAPCRHGGAARSRRSIAARNSGGSPHTGCSAPRDCGVGLRSGSSALAVAPGRGITRWRAQNKRNNNSHHQIRSTAIQAGPFQDVQE
jgi:hypothetical protein